MSTNEKRLGKSGCSSGAAAAKVFEVPTIVMPVLSDSASGRTILRQAPDPVLQASRKRFVSGETLPYLGRNVRLIVDPADVPAPEVRFDHWSFRIAEPIGLDESKCYDEIRKVVVYWYRLRASQRLPRTVELWRKRMGWPETPGVLIRDQRQRWGSCAPDGTLRFASQCCNRNWLSTWLSTN